MKHLFVPYWLALLLKEKGFDEPCLGFYYEDNFELWKRKDICGNSDPVFDQVSCSAPLYQQVIDWLREKHKILAFADTTMDFTAHTPTVQKLGEGHTRVSGQIEFDNYYEALTEAIRHALTLIP
jgi:hypothetical protein